MSKLHESLKQIFSVLDTFLNITLRNESLSKAAEKDRSKVSALLKKLYSDYEDLNPTPSSTSKRNSLLRESKLESMPTARSSSVLSDTERPSSIFETPQEFAPTTVKALTSPTKIGFLTMKTQGTKQKPYCVLHKSTMYWFSKPSDRQQEGAVSVKDYDFKSDDKKIAKKNFSFELVGPGKKPFQFVADSKEDLESWKKAFGSAHEYKEEIPDYVDTNDDGLTYFNELTDDKSPRDLPPTPKAREVLYVNQPAVPPSEPCDEDPYVCLEDEFENIYDTVGSS